MPGPTTDYYDWEEWLSEGTRGGYVFSVSHCEHDEAGIVRRYRITAVPRELGKTGFQAYCTDETGVIHSHASGLAEKCLAEGTPLN